MPDLGKAYVQIVPSAEGISGSIQSALGGEADAAGKSAGLKIAGALKKVVAAAGIGVALKKSISAGADLQQSFGGLETLYGAAADSAKQYAMAAAQAGISANSYAEQAVSFGASLKQAFGGDTTKAVEAANTAIMDMTDNAAKMGTPIESIQMAYQGFAKQNYTMLDNLKLGYGGTKTEMERLLQDAQKISGVEYDMSNLGDVYEAIHVVQDELGLTGVAAEEASQTLSGSFGAMKAAGQNLLASLSLGMDVGPAMEQLVTSMVSVFSNVIPAIGNVLKGLPTAIKTGITTLQPALLEGLKTATESVKQNFPTMLRSAMQGLLEIGSMITENAGQLLDAGLTLVKTIAQGLSNNLPLIITTVIKLVANIVKALISNAPKLIAAGLSLIKSLARGLINSLPAVAAAVRNIITNIKTRFSETDWSAVGSKALKLVVSGIKGVAGLFKSAVKAIVKAVITLLGFDGAVEKAKTAFENIKTAISDKIESAKEKVRGVIDTIKGFFPFNIGNIISGLKLPHFTVSGKFSLNPPSAPHFGVSWYRKAEDNPFLLTKATLFGAGEGKDEVIYGKAALMRDMTKAVESAKGRGGNTFNNYFTINNAENPEAVAQAITTQLKLQMRSA